MNKLNENISTVPSVESVVGCTLLCGQQTLFIQLVLDALDIWGMFLLAFWVRRTVKCIIMVRAVDILPAEDHPGANNKWSIIQSSGSLPHQMPRKASWIKVDLGRSAVWCALKTSNRLAVCKYLYLTDLEAQQSMVTMPDGLDSNHI